MKRFWNAIVDAGVRPDMPYREARFVRACNGVAVVTGLWLLSVIPLFLPYMPAVRSLVISTVVGAAIEFSVPLLNKAGLYRFANLLALGIAQAGSTDADAIRTALEDLKTPYEGLIKTYTRPFTRDNHDALGPDDYIMVHYEGDKIVPVN
jgi:hypothetical protein